MHKRILVVAAHPDDEVLGVGGTIINHTKDGDTVRIMIMAEGITSRSEKRDVDSARAELSALHAKCNEVAKMLGAEKPILCGFPDNRMDSVDLLDVVKEIEKEVESFKPEIVYTHHTGDVNIDHTVTHNAVITACRSLPDCSVRTILFFETLSSSEWQMQTSDKSFMPNWFVDITDSLEQKQNALYLYESEMRPFPHPRSYEAVEHLAKYRGCIIGADKAEAFMLGRNIVKFDGGGYRCRVEIFIPAFSCENSLKESAA